MKYIRVIKIVIILNSILISTVLFLIVFFYKVQNYNLDNIINWKISIEQDIQVYKFITTLIEKTPEFTVNEREFWTKKLFE